MNKPHLHTFHIPVMGLAFTVDTPLKVARFGISSEVSIIEDHLIEKMRELHSKKENEDYSPIDVKNEDHRALRITAYLNLMNQVVDKQIRKLKVEAFEPENDIVAYFEMLPDTSPVKQQYIKMLTADGEERTLLQDELREQISAGSIDVNIMTKIDRINYSQSGEKLPVEFSDAMAALRGYALSNLSSSLVLSAGMNPRLYSYCESFNDFFPDKNEHLKKKLVLKVSDYRSAMIQGKFLAKKGLWISEFRIESGLNCGGHAFATDGLLMGSILEEFKLKREELATELHNMCNAALTAKGKNFFSKQPELKITFQGGIGTAEEDQFLIEHYNLDCTGWGSPFLLVPEATNVDEHTLKQLSTAKKEDYYLSYSSPLGVPFNNFRNSSGDALRQERVDKGKSGSPCYKKFLSNNTEFTAEPICTGSRQYQHLKIKQLQAQDISDETYKKELQKVTEKECLCEGLGAPALVKNNITPDHNLTATSICPGPNLAYFSGIFSLQEMVNHIYGRSNILNSLPRPHVFVNELQLYIDYLKREISNTLNNITSKQEQYFSLFKENLLLGIEYYKSLSPTLESQLNWLLNQPENDILLMETTTSQS